MNLTDITRDQMAQLAEAALVDQGFKILHYQTNGEAKWIWVEHEVYGQVYQSGVSLSKLWMVSAFDLETQASLHIDVRACARVLDSWGV